MVIPAGEMGDGLHLLLEGIDAQGYVTGERVQAFLLEAPEVIGMTRISEPVVAETPDGVTGIVIIAESHISVERRGQWVFVDIFSCKPFHPVTAIDYAFKTLQLTGGGYHAIRRGWLARGEKEPSDEQVTC